MGLLRGSSVHQQQHTAKPLQLRAVRLHSIETRLRTEEAKGLIFTDGTYARQILSSLQPTTYAQQLLDLLEASQHTESKANVVGALTIAFLGPPRANTLSKLLLSG
jgi:hypothetical protein